MKKYAETKLSKVLARRPEKPPPIWLMRQAGRYLPEYKALRTKVGSFWAMAMTPERAVEITLQPIERFGFDAAIIFSDILVVPYALGCRVDYEETGGPRLGSVTSCECLERDEEVWSRKLEPCYEALRLARQKLDAGRSLLGFAGAPWTVATYMAEGGGSTDQRAAKLWGYRDPEGFAEFLSILIDCVGRHLICQLEAGADAVQIFDSWASGLPQRCFREWVIEPTARIVRNVRAVRPEAKIIGFPRGATQAGYEDYARDTGVDVVSLDTAMPMGWAAKTLAPKTAIQGNLDPLALIAGGRSLAQGVADILEATPDAPLIFNLGHGVLPQTPVEHVSELVALVRGER